MLYSWVLRPLYKSYVDWVTGMSELERVVHRASAAGSHGNRVKDTCLALMDLEEVLRDSADPKCKEILACREVGKEPCLSFLDKESKKYLLQEYKRNLLYLWTREKLSMSQNFGSLA